MNETETAHSFFALHAHTPSIGPEVVFHIGSWPIANSTLMLTLSLLIIFFFTLFIKPTSRVPKMFQNVLESLVESIEDLLSQLLGDKKKAEKALPIVGSIFVFIGFSNLIGHIPGVTSITYEGEPLFRTATADFNTTFALAVVAVVAIQVFGVRHNGFFGYLGHFIKIKAIIQGAKQGVSGFFIGLIEFFVGLLELVGEFVKIISLSLRLFGNMFAGKVLMAILLGSFAYVLPAVWLGMEFLVAVVQALVFGSLVTVYYALVTSEENH